MAAAEPRHPELWLLAHGLTDAAVSVVPEITQVIAVVSVVVEWADARAADHTRDQAQYTAILDPTSQQGLTARS
jgi:hypothetical protein